MRYTAQVKHFDRGIPTVIADIDFSTDDPRKARDKFDAFCKAHMLGVATVGYLHADERTPLANMPIETRRWSVYYDEPGAPFYR